MYGWRQRVEAIKRDTIAVYFAARDQRTPWGVKVFAGLVVSYALSPIDLIPDFIPVLGYLDDLILVPIGLWAAISMIPDEVMVECRARAAALVERPVSRLAAAAIMLVWIAAMAAAAWMLYRSLRP